MNSFTVITGPMFSGKTEELIRRIKRAKYANKKVQIFLPNLDTRETRTLSKEFEVEQLDESNFNTQVGGHISLVVIDEAQFITNNSFISELQKVANRGVNLLMAGLDTDYQNYPFGLMPQFMAIADYVVKLTAVCFQCGADATKTYRKLMYQSQIVVGDTDIYEARCRSCFMLPPLLSR